LNAIVKSNYANAGGQLSASGVCSRFDALADHQKSIGDSSVSTRFFHSTLIGEERVVTLGGSEAHHLLHVGRATVGQGVTLFDGSGAEFVAVIEKLGRTSIDLRVVERIEVDRELPFAMIIGVALPKGDRQRWLVEKLTELGVTTLVPLVTERGVAQPTAGAVERWNRAVIEASKQCGRNRLMQIAEPQPWNEWVGTAIEQPNARRLFAHPGGSRVAQVDLTLARPTYAAIGPEGGFTGAEVKAAATAGWQKVALGPRILRVETAAVALAAAIALAE
jgi:16S rRNA (uracil1498-N3)-methyltransferase